MGDGCPQLLDLIAHQIEQSPCILSMPQKDFMINLGSSCIPLRIKMKKLFSLDLTQ